MPPGAMAEPTTKEQWRAFVDYVQRGRTAPPFPERADYLGRLPEERARLDKDRRAYHSEFVIVHTDAMNTIHAEIAQKMELNEFQPGGARRGVAIDGPATVGKSTLVRSFAAAHEIYLRTEHPGRYTEQFDDYIRDYTPVVYISVPTQATPKDLSIAIAEWLGQPHSTSATKTQLTNVIIKAMNRCGVELIIIDDAHMLDVSAKEGRVANDHLKHLANHVPATFVYTGINIERSGLFLEGARAGIVDLPGEASDLAMRASQTGGRYSLFKLRPYRITAEAPAREWISVIASMEGSLLLYGHPEGSLATRHWRYLHERTGGSIAALASLLRESAIKAIRLSGGTAREAITRALMDTITLDVTATHSYQRAKKSTGKPAKRTAAAQTPAATDRQAAGT